jgi:hypothetical protein
VQGYFDDAQEHRTSAIRDRAALSIHQQSTMPMKTRTPRREARNTFPNASKKHAARLNLRGRADSVGRA